MNPIFKSSLKFILNEPNSDDHESFKDKPKSDSFSNFSKEVDSDSISLDSQKSVYQRLTDGISISPSQTSDHPQSKKSEGFNSGPQLKTGIISQKRFADTEQQENFITNSPSELPTKKKKRTTYKDTLEQILGPDLYIEDQELIGQEIKKMIVKNSPISTKGHFKNFFHNLVPLQNRLDQSDEENSPPSPFDYSNSPTSKIVIDLTLPTSSPAAENRKIFFPDEINPEESQKLALSDAITSRRMENIVFKGKEAFQMLLSGDFESARSNYELIFSLNCTLESTFSHWINYASLLFHTNKIDYALTILEQMNQIYCKKKLDFDVAYCLGRINMEKNEFQLASTYTSICYTKLDLFHGNFKFLVSCQYGYLSAKCGNYHNALEAFIKANRFKQGDIMVLSWLGETCLKLNKQAESNGYFERALKAADDTDTLTYRHYPSSLLEYKINKIKYLKNKN